MNDNLQKNSTTIEAILFATAEPYTVPVLAGMLHVSVEETQAAISELEASLQDRAVMVVRQGDTIILATRPEHSVLLEALHKEELQKDLSKASAETLAVVVYHPGASKAEIELIRGVNASYSLRALQIRGLIETKSNGRTAAYYPTVALLESYGVSSAEQLPQYAETKQKIDTLL